MPQGKLVSELLSRSEASMQEGLGQKPGRNDLGVRREELDLGETRDELNVTVSCCSKLQ